MCPVKQKAGDFIKKVKGISYDTEIDSDVIRYLNSIDNYSKYVLEIIRDDMLCRHKFQTVIDYVYDLIIDKSTNNQTATIQPLKNE